MAQFMLLIMGTGEGVASLPQEEQDAHMQKWFDWDDELEQSGVKISGEALHVDGSKVILGKEKQVQDGFYAGDPSVVVGGYYLIDVEDMNAAIEIAKDCPTFELDGNVEVRKVMTEY